MKKKVFSSSVVLNEDGNRRVAIIEHRVVQRKRYIMEIIEEDYTWIKKFSRNELIYFKILADKMDNSNMVAVTSLFKKEVMRILNIPANLYYKMVKSMVEKDAIIKLSASDIMVNPRYYVKTDVRNIHQIEKLYRDNNPKQITDGINGKSEFDV